MPAVPTSMTIGVLASGGLDSCILVAHLLRQGRAVQPIYVRAGLFWEAEELSSLRAFLASVAMPRLEQLLVLDLPLGDLYGDHWSVNGRNTPDARSADDAVYLPGRNALLTLKPAVWCAMHGIEELALATLASNPFADATEEFFTKFEEAIHQATGSRIHLVRPFAELEKKDVMALGRDMPLESTFSCIVPVAGLHCGQCNKCAERRRAFEAVDLDDPTHYARGERRGEQESPFSLSERSREKESPLSFWERSRG